MSLINSENTWALWTVIVVSVALAVWLEKSFKWAAKMSVIVIILLLAIVLSNVNIIPAESGVYDTVWDYLVPLSLPLLLFKADLKRICSEAGHMLVAFLLGAIGTVVGTLVSFLLFNRVIPELAGLSAMMTGTYTGGSVNFAALAVVFDVSGEMISAATIADNLNMAIYFFILLSIPVKAAGGAIAGTASTEPSGDRTSKKPVSVHDIALGLGAALLIVTVSRLVADFFSEIIPTANIPLEMLNSFIGNKYLWITTVSVICATVWPKLFGNITGIHEIGTFFIYCFMFVIGAPASIKAILIKSPLLLVFAFIIVVFNMLFTFVGGKLLKMDRRVLIIASNANVGGPTTAASMAIAKDWEELVGPALLIGCLGYVIGNYLGIMVGYLCQIL